MPRLLKRGDQGQEVIDLQTLLRDEWDYDVKVDGDFGPKTQRAVKQFQSTHHDEHGSPLVVDGEVGDLTWWSLTHRRDPRPEPQVPAMTGGSRCGRKAMNVAVQELNANAREIGGNNRGQFVRKYLRPTGLPEGNPWCAAFVSWCFLEACNGAQADMPFPYMAGARNVFNKCRQLGFQTLDPQPGDLIIWWRESLHSGKGHIGFVESVKDGFVYTIEGNKTPKVARFKYVIGRIDQLIGFIHIPDAGC